MYARELNESNSELRIRGETILTYTSVTGTCCNVLTCWIKSTAQNFALYDVPFTYIYLKYNQMVKYTECAPARLTIGASRLLVLWTVRISPLFRSSFVEDIAIWLLGGGVALALLISAPPADGDSDRLDIFSGRQVKTSVFKFSGKRRSFLYQIPIDALLARKGTSRNTGRAKRVY